MASKMQKMRGIPRIATNDFAWNGFNLRQGYAYGMDEEGNLFVSPCTTSDDGGLFIWVASDTPISCMRKGEIKGHYCGFIGARAVLMEAGFYSTEWGFRWRPTSIPKGSVLARRIIDAKRQAKPCTQRPYSGLRQLCPAGF